MAGTSPNTMLSAIIFFFSSVLTGIIIGVFGGSILDVLDAQFRALGWMQTGTMWGDLAGYDFAINLFYSLAYIIPLLGIFILFSTIYHRYGKDKRERIDEDDYDAGAYHIDRGRL